MNNVSENHIKISCLICLTKQNLFTCSENQYKNVNLTWNWNFSGDTFENRCNTHCIEENEQKNLTKASPKREETVCQKRALILTKSIKQQQQKNKNK